MKMFLYKAADPQSHAELGKKLQALKPGKEYVVSVKENKSIRSLSANRYYRAVLKIIAIHTGETEDRLHMLFKSMFNYEEFTLPNGDVRRIPATTSDKDTKEFSQYISQVKQWAIDEFQIYFPEKHDMDYMREMDIENQYDKIQG